MDGDDPIIGCGMSDAGLPPSAAAPPNDAMAKLRRYVESLPDLQPDYMLTFGDITLGDLRAIVAASREGGSSPDREAIAELVADYRDGMESAAFFAKWGVDAGIGLADIIRQAKAPSRERAAALPQMDVERLRTALEWYASEVWGEAGQVAREALRAAATQQEEQ